MGEVLCKPQHINYMEHQGDIERTKLNLYILTDEDLGDIH